MFEEIHITMVGMQFHNPKKVVRPGDIVHLVKDVHNEYDEEAIAVLNEELERIGYVANSTRTVAKGTYSAGRIYDRFTNVAIGVVSFILKGEAIVRIAHFNQSDSFFQQSSNKEQTSFSLTIRKH